MAVRLHVEVKWLCQRMHERHRIFSRSPFSSFLPLAGLPLDFGGVRQSCAMPPRVTRRTLFLPKASSLDFEEAALATFAMTSMTRRRNRRRRKISSSSFGCGGILLLFFTLFFLFMRRRRRIRFFLAAVVRPRLALPLPRVMVVSLVWGGASVSSGQSRRLFFRLGRGERERGT